MYSGVFAQERYRLAKKEYCRSAFRGFHYRRPAILPEIYPGKIADGIVNIFSGQSRGAGPYNKRGAGRPGVRLEYFLASADENVR